MSLGIYRRTNSFKGKYVPNTYLPSKIEKFDLIIRDYISDNYYQTIELALQVFADSNKIEKLIGKGMQSIDCMLPNGDIKFVNFYVNKDNITVISLTWN